MIPSPTLGVNARMAAGWLTLAEAGELAGVFTP